MASDDVTPPPADDKSSPSTAQPAPPSAGLDKETRYWATGCHLAGFALYLSPIPVLGVVAPLVIWLIKRENSPFIDAHGKAVVNFQLSLLIYLFVSAILVFVIVGFLLILALIVMQIILTINGAVRAQNGEPYRYPVAIRFIR
ncbi:MAG: DUF4870 domain-containing protein [Planctomycetota bacterium]